MTQPTTIARPYAEACFRLARDGGRLSAWSDMLAALELVVRDGDVSMRIGDPRVHRAALRGFIVDALGEALDQEGRNLVDVLVITGRLELSSQIRRLYEALRRDHEARVDARIVSAQPVTREQLQALLAALERRCGRQVNAQLEIDSALIGGARIVIGDKVIDGTVRGRLDAMSAALTH